MAARPSDRPEARRIRRAEVAGFTLTEGMHPGGSSLPWHAHAGATICFVLEGSFTEYSRGAALACFPSFLKFTPAGEGHWDRFDRGDARGLLIEVDPERERELRPHVAVLDRQVHFEGGAVGALATRIHQELRTTDEAREVAIEGLLLELLATASRRVTAGASLRLSRWLEDAREMIHADAARHLGLGTLAAAVGVHPVTLARAFRRTYGCSVGDYIRQRRVDRAAEQLRTSATPLAEIAIAAGFADQSHFSNVFRRQTGVSPSRYRELVREVGSRLGGRSVG